MEGEALTPVETVEKTAAVSERHVFVDHLTSPCALTISDDFTLFPYVCQ